MSLVFSMRFLKLRAMSKVKHLFFAPFFLVLKALGVNVHHFQVLLSAKLKMDFRRAPNSFQSAGKKQTFIKQLFIYGFLGMILITSLYRMNDLMLQLSVFFSFLIVFVGTILLTEFTSVLFDDKDNHILLPRPISSRTLLLVRLVHILVYVCTIAFSLSLPFSVYLAYSVGWLALVFLMAVFLCAWFTLISSVGFFLLLSKFVSIERFKDVLNYFQIGLAIVIMASYQLVPYMIDDKSAADLSFSSAWWTFLIPSVWFGGFTQFVSGLGGVNELIMTLICLAVSVFGSVFLVRILSKGFNSIIAESGTATQKKKTKKERVRASWLNKVQNWLCISEAEIAGWLFTMSHVKSDRKLKQQIYPSFAYSFIMLIVFLKPDVNNLSQFMVELSESYKYLFFILTGYFGTVALSIIPYTDTPKASWIYDMASSDHKYHIQSGAIKAVLFTFYLPLYCIYFIPIVLIWGVDVLPSIVLGAFLTAILSILLVRIQNHPLPFSKAREMINKGEYTLKMFLGLFLIGLVIGLVYLVSMVHTGLSIALCVIMPFVMSFSYRLVRNNTNCIPK